MSTKQSSITTLPCELRLEIYSYTLTSITSLDMKPAVIPTKTNKWWQRPFRDFQAPGLLLTNRLIRDEALQLYHKFLLDHLVDLQGKIDAIDKKGKCMFIVGPNLSPKKDTLLRCQRDAVEKEIRLVEKEMEGREATAEQQAEQQAEQRMSEMAIVDDVKEV